MERSRCLVEGGDRLRLGMSSLSDDKGYLFVEADAAKQIGDRGADTTALRQGNRTSV